MANNKRGRPFKAESPRAKAPKFARISEAEPHERRRSSRVKPTARVLRPEPKFGEWDAEAIRAETETRHWIEWTPKITATGRKIYYKNSWEPKGGASDALLADWEAEKKRINYTIQADQGQQQQNNLEPSSSETAHEEPVPKRRRTANFTSDTTSPLAYVTVVIPPPIEQKLSTVFSHRTVIPDSQSFLETSSSVAHAETHVPNSGGPLTSTFDIAGTGGPSDHQVALSEVEPKYLQDEVQTAVPRRELPLQINNSTPSPIPTEIYERSHLAAAGSEQLRLEIHEPPRPVQSPLGSTYETFSSDHSRSNSIKDGGIDLTIGVAQDLTPHTAQTPSSNRSTSRPQSAHAPEETTSFDTDDRQTENGSGSPVDESQASQDAQELEGSENFEPVVQAEDEPVTPVDSSQASQEAQDLEDITNLQIEGQQIEDDPVAPVNGSQSSQEAQDPEDITDFQTHIQQTQDEPVASLDDGQNFLEAWSPEDLANFTPFNSSAIASESETANIVLPRSEDANEAVEEPQDLHSKVSSEQVDHSQRQENIGYSSTTESVLESESLPAASIPVARELVENHSALSFPDGQLIVDASIYPSVEFALPHYASNPAAPISVGGSDSTGIDPLSRSHTPVSTASTQIAVEPAESHLAHSVLDTLSTPNTLPEHSASLLPADQLSSSLALAPSTFPGASPAANVPPRPHTPVPMSSHPQVAMPFTPGSVGLERAGYGERRRNHWANKNKNSPAASITNAELGNSRPASRSGTPTPTQGSRLAFSERSFCTMPSRLLPAVAGKHGGIPDKLRNVGQEDPAPTTENPCMVRNSTNLPIVENPAISSSSQTTFCLPLPLSSESRRVFKQVLRDERNIIKSFLDQFDPSQEPEVLKTVRKLMEKLYNVISHPDLVNNRPCTLQDSLPKFEIERWCTVSSKFKFLQDFSRAVSGSDMHVVIFAKAGRMLDMIQTFMSGSGTYCRYEYGNNELISPLCVTLLPTGEQGASIVGVNRADLVIGFDDTFNVQEPQVDRVRRKILEVDQSCPVIQIIVANSLEHISRSLPVGLSDAESMRTLIARAMIVSERGAELPTVPDLNLGEIIANAMLVETGKAWVLPSIDDIALPDFDDQESIKLLEPMGNSNTLKRKSPQSADEELAISMKKPRLSLTTRQAPPSTNVRDEATLSALQTRFEDQSQHIRALQAQLFIATNGRTAAGERNHALSNTIKELKAKNQALSTEFEDFRNKSLLSPFPVIRETAELREKAQSAGLLEKKLEAKICDFEFLREQYQRASASALEHALENEKLEEENGLLKFEASGEKVRLRQIYEQNNLRMAHSEIERLKTGKQHAEKVAQKLGEQLRAAKQREKEREKGSGLPVKSKANGTPPNRHAAPGLLGKHRSGSKNLVGSRQASPQRSPLARESKDWEAE